MDELKRDIRRQTESGRGMIFDAGSWKEDSDRLFTPEKVSALYHEMAAKQIVPPPDADFVFVSPTANIPTHERQLFAEDQKTRRGNGLFLVGDMSKLPVEKSDVHKVSLAGAFQYFRWDAESLPLRKESVDMIWDRKGWIWYLAVNWESERLAQTLQQYHDLLKEGGSVVIDDIGWFDQHMRQSKEGEKFMRALERYISMKARGMTRPSFMIRDPNAMEYEYSTSDLINTNTPDVLFMMEQLFDFDSVGDGPGKMKVMRKRAKGSKSA